MITLAKLNDLRTSNGKQPLKAWKESKAKLEAAYAKELAIADATFEASEKELAQQTVRPKEEVEVAEVAHKDKRPTKQIMKDIKAKQSADTFTLAALAKELGIDPKQARAKARKHLRDRAVDGWTFNAADRQHVIDVLKKGR